MATRSRIGIMLSDESILSAYHHWDGYPEWLGKTLKEHYNTKDKVAELIDGGDMSICWTKDRWDNSADGSYAPQYYSQRGEDCPPRHDKNLEEYLSEGEEYAYLYKNCQWKCYDLHGQFPKEVEIPEKELVA